jgi:hypothetical protein
MNGNNTKIEAGMTSEGFEIILRISLTKIRKGNEPETSKTF